MKMISCHLKLETNAYRTMKTKTVSTSFWMALLLTTLMASAGFGQTTVVSDNCTATNVGSGFGFDNGVNSGINPPNTNRITGTVASTLRYLQTATARPTTEYTINNNRMRVTTDNSIGRYTISGNGATPFDFGPAVGASYASSTNRAVYDVKISMRNDASSNARFSFAIATQEGDTSVWDFGLQMYRAATANTFYTLQKRIDTGSSGLASDLNATMATTAAGTVSNLISFLIRITDAGAQTNGFDSRVQVSIDNGATWIYDTDTDAALTSGTTNHWRFDGSARYIIFDQAPNTSGPVFYDNFSIVSTYAPAAPAERTWTGGGLDDNWSTADNWGGTAINVGTPAVFNGTVRQTNVNDFAAMVLPYVVFNNGGFSLGGNNPSISSTISNLAGINTFASGITWESVALKTYSIATGSELVLSGNSTNEVNGDLSLVGGGTLRLKGTMNIGQLTTANPAFILNEGQHIVDGGTFKSGGGYRIGSSTIGAGAQTILTNGGVLNLTAAGGNLRVGDSANANPSRLEINNSTVTMSGAALGVPYTAGASGIVNQVGGLVSGCIVAFNDNGAGTGTYNLKDGVLEVVQIRDDTAAGSSTISFDNGTLRPASSANAAAFFSGVDSAILQSGGLVLDASSDVTIAQALSGTGPLIKSNAATVTLTGTNTYSGNTIIQSGKLVLPTIQTNATTVQVGNGAELGVLERAAGSSLSVAGLQFNGASFGALTFDLGAFNNPTAPLMKASSLSASGPVTINIINGVQLAVGQFVLVDYDGSIGGGFGQFSLGSLPSGVTATLVDNTANSSIDLNITTVPGFRWTGAIDGNWDFSTQNWVDQQTASASTYADGYPTLFTDTASNGVVNISGGIVTPSVIVVSNNTLPYSWTGGNLTVDTIRKYGTNSLIRTNWSSGDYVNNIEINEGIFGITHGDDYILTNKLTDTSAGTGTFAKYGANTMLFTSKNTTYDGKVLIQEGTLKLTVSSTNALGTTNGSTVIASGATLDVNDQIYPYEPFIVSGNGVNGAGAIIDTTTGGGVAHNLTDVTMVGDTAFGAPNGGRWDIRVRSSTGPGPGLRGNGYNLRKVGSGYVSLACQRNIGVNTPYWDMNLGDVTIEAGTLAIAESLTLGNPAKALTIMSGATLQLFDLGITNPLVRNITMTDAKLNCGGGDTDTNVVNGNISMTGANSIRSDQAVFTINGAITGSGILGISANDPGRLYLNGVNTFSGDTFVTNGTIGGTGVVAGNLTMLGGTNAPGNVTTSVGTLTVNGNLTLAGTTFMELNRSLPTNSDRLVAGGNLIFGGVLKVVLASGASAPQAGDVYQLFNKGANSGSFTIVSLPTLSGGLSWVTSNLVVNGTISVSGPPPSPNISSTSVVGGNFVMSGTGGVEGSGYTILTSTNVALPVANWIPISSNVFGTGGTFSFTNSIDPTNPYRFFLLRIP